MVPAGGPKPRAAAAPFVRDHSRSRIVSPFAYTKAVPAPDPDNGALLQRQALALPTVTAEAYGAIPQVNYGKRPQNVKANQTLAWRARGAGGDAVLTAG